jgi:hypothetical protein
MEGISLGQMVDMKNRQDIDGLARVMLNRAGGSERITAAELLGSTINSKAIEPLLEGLRLIAVLEKELGEYHGSVTGLRDTIERALGELIPTALGAREALVRATGDEYWRVREQAIRILGMFGNTFTPYLINGLKDQHEYVRLTAARVLGQEPEAKRIPPLITTLNDPNSSVRSLAAESLGKIGTNNAEVIQPLRELLKDGDKFTAQMAAKALERLGDKPS